MLSINPKTFWTVDSVENKQQGEEAGDYSTLQRDFVQFLLETYLLAHTAKELILDIMG